jgi:hypothetical protein
LNLRPPAPHAGALAELRYAPMRGIIPNFYRAMSFWLKRVVQPESVAADG